MPAAPPPSHRDTVFPVPQFPDDFRRIPAPVQKDAPCPGLPEMRPVDAQGIAVRNPRVVHTALSRRIARPLHWGVLLLATSLGMPRSAAVARAQSGAFFIDRFLTNAVLVHFDTEASRRYELQFSTNGPAPAPTAWKKLFAVAPVPFKDHFIVYHELTNGPTGFYRLKITP
jgi:hypothetical protein